MKEKLEREQEQEQKRRDHFKKKVTNNDGTIKIGRIVDQCSVQQSIL